jgi:hypothetical protein
LGNVVTVFSEHGLTLLIVRHVLIYFYRNQQYFAYVSKVCRPDWTGLEDNEACYIYYGQPDWRKLSDVMICKLVAISQAWQNPGRKL